MKRGELRVSPLWWPLLALFEVRPGRAWVERSTDRLIAVLGWYRIETSRRDIEHAESTSSSEYTGIGLRGNLRGVLGLIGLTEASSTCT